MKSIIITAVIILVSISAHATFYRCQVDGRTVISNIPCAGQDFEKRETQTAPKIPEAQSKTLDPIPSNPTHNNLIAMPETQRQKVMTDVLTGSGLSCSRVNDTFYQGSDETGNAYWNAACAGGQSYSIQVRNDSQGSTRILTCNEVKLLNLTECFTKF